MKKLQLYNAGFTLIELLLYVSISAGLLLGVSLSLSTLLEARVKNQTISEVEQQGLHAMYVMTQVLRNAEGINFPATSTAATSVLITTSVASTSPTLFEVVNGVLHIKEGATEGVHLTNSRVVVSGLSFLNASRANTSGIVRIRFTITSTNTSGRNEYAHTQTFISSASLRKP